MMAWIAEEMGHNMTDSDLASSVSEISSDLEEKVDAVGDDFAAALAGGNGTTVAGTVPAATGKAAPSKAGSN